jgi:hypothetical protein
MMTGTTKIRIYTGQVITYDFASDGHLKNYVWVTDEAGTRYYWAQDPVTGWQTIDGKRYYFDPATALMATGNVEIDGQTYAFGDDGVFVHEGAHEFTFSRHVAQTCTQAEADIYVCSVCGKTHKEVIKPAARHADANGDNICDVCGEKINLSFLDRIRDFFARIRDFFRRIRDFFVRLFTR